MNLKLLARIVLALGLLIAALLGAVVYLWRKDADRNRVPPIILQIPPPEPIDASGKIRNPRSGAPLPARAGRFVSAQPPIPAPGHWPQWRGPRRDNCSEEKGLLKVWLQEGPPLLWEAKDLGQGKGGIAVAGGLIFLLGYRDGLEFLTALDGAGRIAWAAPIGAAVNEVDHMRWLSQRTPTVDDDRVYAVTARGSLLCLNSANGDLLWQRDYALDFGGKPGVWRGYCDFPLADGPRVICTPSGPKSTVVALDRRTGSTVWSCDVPGTRAGTQSTLIPCVLAGIRQYVAQLDSKIVGISPETGRLLWSFPMASDGGCVQVAIPFGDQTVLSVDGWGNSLEMLELVRSENQLIPKVLYQTRAIMQSWSANELRVGDRLFYFQERSSVACVDLRSGIQLFRKRVGQGCFATTFSDGLFYLRGGRGEVTLAEPTSDNVEILSSFESPHGREDTWTFPVVAGGRLYLRDQGRLFCYDLKAPEYEEAPPVWNIASRVRPGAPGTPGPNLAPPKGEPDAIFVPTPMDVVERMLKLAGVVKADRVVDLGSGDGRVLIAASGIYGCKSVGYEIDPTLVLESRARIQARGLASLAAVEDRDLFQADLSSYSVVTLYLGERNNARLVPQLLKLKPGSRIVSHAHDLGIPGLIPMDTVELNSSEDGATHTIYLWTTPLPVK